MADKQKKKFSVFTIVCVLIMVCSIGYICYAFFGNSRKTVADETNTEAAQYADDSVADYLNVTYNGKNYTYNRNLKTVLFLGIDQHDEASSYSYKGTGGRSDCMILFVMDTENNTAKMLEISRDTMVKVAVYDASGEYAIDSTMQITMQYSYGDGANKSCRLTKEAVSKLLHDIPVDQYFSMNIDGISLLTDVIGGVTIQIPNDYTDIDDAFEKGATVTLDGKMAEKYVRKRDTSVTGSNDLRMERQTQYIKALVGQMKQMNADEDMYEKWLNAASSYIVTDMQADDIYELSKYNLDDNDLKVPGQTKQGEFNDEYYVDEEALQKMLIDVFYVEN